MGATWTPKVCRKQPKTINWATISHILGVEVGLRVRSEGLGYVDGLAFRVRRRFRIRRRLRV